MDSPPCGRWCGDWNFRRSYARANLEWEFRIPPVAAVTAADGLKICCWIAEFHCARESLACGLAGTYCAIIAHSVMGTAISVQRWTMKTLRLISGASAGKNFWNGLSFRFERSHGWLDGDFFPRDFDASRLEPARPRTMESYRRSGSHSGDGGGTSASADGSSSVTCRTTEGWSAGGGGNPGQAA